MTERSPTAKARLAGGPVYAIAWNANCSAVAVSHGGSDVDVYEVSSSSGAGGGLSFAKAATLSGHGQFVSGLDWSTRGDQLLSCSHDRNAFVWTRAAAAAGRAASGAAASTSGGGGGSGAWEKQMVITRLTKGALCVQWSPSEAKFAIGSAARNVCVGYYDPESKWWACKLIRKAHESSVVSVAWHPSSLLLATGSTDRRVRLFNAYVRGYEPDAPAGALPEGSSFGDCLFEVAHEGCGWVHSVVFADPAGAAQQQLTPGTFPQLLYASHDFVFGAVDAVGGGAPAATAAVRLPDAFLPLKCLAVVVPGRLAVGGGWSGGLAVLRNTGSGWQLAATLGTRDVAAVAAGGGGGGGGGAGGGGGGAGAGGSAVARQIAALNLNSVNMVAPGGAAASTAGGSAAGAGGGEQPGHGGALVTGLHVRPAAGVAAPGPRWHVASCGLDGQVLLWDLSAFLG
ncbi:hypothetical protein HXX76_003191 [Chlamydomonas incerta]|uniref:Arp2/3 complex 41 kDa subunit n=1 Tax=Chlamydomonas incerta TaxID=51695 RepID=A0A835TMF1_CHLIN|nr:hypothetical protein HXX76_003191 [Chlamydomonas incerta]|eukprot:KAG2441570.1 hypothetical protein HXX76_003191 [Chlamydomonas incerta]